MVVTRLSLSPGRFDFAWRATSSAKYIWRWQHATGITRHLSAVSQQHCVAWHSPAGLLLISITGITRHLSAVSQRRRVAWHSPAGLLLISITDPASCRCTTESIWPYVSTAQQQQTVTSFATDSNKLSPPLNSIAMATLQQMNCSSNWQAYQE